MKHLISIVKFESNEIKLVTASEFFIKIFYILSYTIGNLYKQPKISHYLFIKNHK
jgi:hypothetical protein